MPLDINTLTRDERGILLYAETCLVDGSGLLTGERMNKADLDALAKFKAAGILDFGRIPARLLSSMKPLTHWVTFTDAAWELAHALRRQRAAAITPNRFKVVAALAERAAPATQEG